MPNQLAKESSPYLLQHADNPVDWYPWGEKALALARERDRPILLSIGYAACHWCHVMAHESFEDPETAEFMNQHFVNIKVDREERPDLDKIYMDAVVAMTGQGGWPMTVALTPAGAPFFGGTYFPPNPRYGMPSFKQVLTSLVNAWETRRTEIVENASQVAAHLGRSLPLMDSSGRLSEETLDQAIHTLKGQYDSNYGGFGGAPKFPQPMIMEFLLRSSLRRNQPELLKMVVFTLTKMASGGIYDQIGGGFSRYATDNRWLVPHFEKMLYDNALLSRLYLHAWKLTGDPLFRRIVEETLDWVLAEMRHPRGGFYSSLDADSEGEEGKYYVWDSSEFDDSLGEDAELGRYYFGVSAGGNWEGHNILYLARDITQTAEHLSLPIGAVIKKLNRARQILYVTRAKRVRPGRDEKILTAWNGLMIASLAEAGRDLQRSDYLEAAKATAEFIYTSLRVENGRLLRSWKDGSGAKYNAYLEDYSFLADGLLALYQSTFEIRWYEWAVELGRLMIAHFQDADAGGFFDTSDDHEPLLHRPKSLQDNAIPSGNSAAALVLLSLSLYAGDVELWDLAEEAVSTFDEVLTKYPTGFAHWLTAADFILSQPKEVAIIGDLNSADTIAMIHEIIRTYSPHQVVAVGNGHEPLPLLSGRNKIKDQATAYVCRRFVCDAPVFEPDRLREKLN